MSEQPPWDGLYLLAPEAFTAERNRLARRFREAGDHVAARTVAGLRRPTVAAWALNQVARSAPDDIAELLAAEEALASAQAAALSGSGGKELRAAADVRQRLVRRLAQQAAQVCQRRGVEVSPPMEAITATLLAASTGAEAGALLRAGRLHREVSTSGLEAFGVGAPPAAGAQSTSTGNTQPPARAEPAGLRTATRLSAAERRRRSAEQEREAAAVAATEVLARQQEAQATADRADAAAEEAAEQAARLADAATEATAEATRLSEAAAGAAEAARRARRDAERARRHADRLTERTQQAADRLAAAEAALGGSPDLATWPL